MTMREEILAAYEAGPEAVVAYVEQALALMSSRVQELERRLNQNSQNSHRPPSSDPPFKKPQSLRPKPGQSGKKSGGQSGHPGQTLCQVATPDAVLQHVPVSCTECGHSLAEVAPSGTPERRQVFDLPPQMRLFVTEHVAESRCCPGCQATTKGAFPKQVSAPVQYGAGILALGVYLRTSQLLPSRRASELIEHLFGAVAPSEATLAGAMAQAAEALLPVEALIRQGLHCSEVVHFDETGLRITVNATVNAAGSATGSATGSKSKLHWLHVAATDRLTLYTVHPKRGREALEAIKVLPGFSGTGVHDAYHSYLSYPSRHALCNAHLLRELVALSETTQQRWPEALRALLGEIKREAERSREVGASEVAAAQRSQFRARYEALLIEGRAANPPRPPSGCPSGEPTKRRGRRKRTPAENLLRRLEKHASAVLAFLYDLRVPFDNNLAERDLRMMKVQQKISGTFRRLAGAAEFCRVRGYLSTIHKQNLPPLSALRSLFSGDPIMPQITT